MPLEDLVMDELEQEQAERQELLLGETASAKKPQSKYKDYNFFSIQQKMFLMMLNQHFYLGLMINKIFMVMK